MTKQTPAYKRGLYQKRYEGFCKNENCKAPIVGNAKKQFCSIQCHTAHKRALKK